MLLHSDPQLSKPLESHTWAVSIVLYFSDGGFVCEARDYGQ